MGTKTDLRWLWPPPTNKSRKWRNAFIYETYEHLRTTTPIQSWMMKKVYDGYGHPPTTKTEDTDAQTFMKPMNTKKWWHIQNWRKNQQLQWLWPPAHKQIQEMNKSKHLWHLWTLKGDDANSQLEAEQYLRWLWPPTHTQNPEEAGTQIFMRPVKI